MKKPLVLLCFMLMTIYSSAQTRRYVNQAATGLNNGTSWNDAYSDLQTAITSCSVDDTLWIASGKYIPDITTRYTSFVVNGIKMFGGFVGNETSLSQRNPKENPTILSGDRLGNDNGFINNAENTLHIIVVSAAGNTNVIDGFYIEGANADGSVGSQRLGGGIKISDGTATSLDIRNCIMRNNFAFNGAAVYLYSNSSYHTINIENCVFANNESSINGSTICRYYQINLTVNNCTFVSNGDNAIYSGSSTGYYKIYNSVFSNHEDTYIESESSAEFTIDHCLFDDDPSAFSGLTVFTNNLINTNPLLGDDFQLLPSSPARDAGTNDVITASYDLAQIDRIMNGTVDIGAYEFNTTPPEVTISTNFTETNDTLIEASVIFNEPVTGLESTDFVISNAALSSITEVNSGLEYTIKIKHDLTGLVSIELPYGCVLNLNEIENMSSSVSYTYTDTIIPKVILEPEYQHTSNLTQTISVSFSEEITGLDIDDFLATNGTISNLQTVKEGFAYSVDITASSEGEVGISLKEGAVLDRNSLSNKITTISYMYSVINGINNINAEIVRIYPNPANNFVIVNFNGTVNYEMYNETGVPVAKGSDKQIDVSNFEGGIYILRIFTSDNKVHNSKLILKR